MQGRRAYSRRYNAQRLGSSAALPAGGGAYGEEVQGGGGRRGRSTGRLGFVEGNVEVFGFHNKERCSLSIEKCFDAFCFEQRILSFYVLFVVCSTKYWENKKKITQHKTDMLYFTLFKAREHHWGLLCNFCTGFSHFKRYE